MIMSFLDIFTGPRVEAAGLLWASLSGAFLLHGGHQIGFFVALAAYFLSRFEPKLFKFLEGFAEVPAWPNYVSLAVAALFAAHAGGHAAVITLMGLAMAGDGRMFDALY